MDAQLPSAPKGPAPLADPGRRGWIRLLLVALVLPLVLFGPKLLTGKRFVSVLPVSVEPLRSEHPEAAAGADRAAHWVTGDRLFPFLTDQIAIREEVRSGHLPTWNPSLGLGLPLFAGTLAAVAYPPNWLAILLPPEEAAGILAILSLALFGLGCGLFLRRLDLAPGAVACGVVAAEMGGWGFSNLPYFMKVDAAVWIPWSLWAAEGCLKGKRWSGAHLSGAIALSFLAGFVPIAIFGLALVGTWTLVRWLALRRTAPGSDGSPSRLGWCAVFMFLGLAASAVQTLPTWETSRQSERQSGGDLRPQSLPDAVLWGTILPDLFGGPDDTTPADGSPLAWWLTDPDEFAKAQLVNALEWNTYALASAVLLALVAIVATPRRAAFPALALTLVFGFALGRAPASWLYAVPGLNLGAPGRVLSLAWLLWPWLAALGVDALLRRKPRANITFLVGAFSLAAGAFVLWIGIDAEHWARDLELTLLDRYGERFNQTLETIRERIPPDRALAAAEQLRRSLAHALGAGLACFVAAILTAFSSRGGSRLGIGVGIGMIVAFAAAAPIASNAVPLSALAAVAIGAACLLLLLALPGPLAWAPLLACIVAEGTLAEWNRVGGLPVGTDEIFPPSPTVEAIREASGSGRVLRYDKSPNGLSEMQRLARPNLLSAYGISDLTPYLVFTPGLLFELVETLDPRMLSRRHIARLADLSKLDDPLLDLLDVRAVLSVDPLEHPRLSPVLERPGFHVYHREGSFQQARIVRDAIPAASDAAALESLGSGGFDFRTATIVAPEHVQEIGEVPPPPLDWKPGDIESLERPHRSAFDVSVWGSSGGWLVMHEQWAPGWRAKVNGEEVPLLRVDHAMRAVRIPRGESRIETWYAPASIRHGAWITFISVLAALVAAAWRERRAGTRPHALSDPIQR